MNVFSQLLRNFFVPRWVDESHRGRVYRDQVAQYVLLLCFNLVLTARTDSQITQGLGLVRSWCWWTNRSFDFRLFYISKMALLWQIFWWSNYNEETQEKPYASWCCILPSKGQHRLCLCIFLSIVFSFPYHPGLPTRYPSYVWGVQESLAALFSSNFLMKHYIFEQKEEVGVNDGSDSRFLWFVLLC